MPSSTGGKARQGELPGAAAGFSRRSFLQRASLLGAASILAQLPALLDARGLLAAAAAQSPDLTADTLSGLVAFVLPGDDPYSVAQGESFGGPGGIAAGAVRPLTEDLDRFMAVSVGTGTDPYVPASGGVAAMLNGYALKVNPAASRGGFPSLFSRLSFAEKAKVFELMESDPSTDGTELRFVAGVLPGLVCLAAVSEAGVWDPKSRTVTKTPVGWEITGYGGPADGHDEFKGYWHGFRSAIDSGSHA